MSVARLRQSADITGWDKAAHSHSPSRVSLSLQEQVYEGLYIFVLNHITVLMEPTHILLIHSGAEQSHREEDFYYTEVFSEEDEPTSPSLSSSFTSALWSSYSSAPSQHTSRDARSSSSTLSQSAPGSVWQIHTEHLYQVKLSCFSSLCRSNIAREQKTVVQTKESSCTCTVVLLNDSEYA